MTANNIDNRHIRVFISSTFNDMQSERDELVSKIFPILRKKAAERNVTVTDIDLRWGITEEESRNGKVIDICLDEIEKSHPFFIGLLGSRYGWTPAEDKDADYGTVIEPRHGWATDDIRNGLSITEMEIRYGALRSDSPVYGSFFLKDCDESGIDPRQARLRQEIREQDRYEVHVYGSMAEFTEQVIGSFDRLLDTLYPEGSGDSLESRRAQQRYYLQQKTMYYIPDKAADKRIEDFLHGSRSNLLVTGTSGMGKSTLLAWHALRLMEDVNQDVIAFFAGNSAHNATFADAARWVCLNLSDFRGIEYDASENPLIQLGRMAGQTASGKRLVIIIDGINQLSDSGGNDRNLVWWPEWPENVKVIFSSPQNAEIIKELDLREWELASIGKMTIDGRIELAGKYFSQYRKELSREQKDLIGNDWPLLGNTLIYVSFLDELRRFGSFGDLDRFIFSLAGCRDSDEFFSKLLDRQEILFKDSKADGLVRDVMTLIHLSESGLTETQLLSITGASRLSLSQLLGMNDMHLAVRGGRVTEAHSMFRNAVSAKYLTDKDYETAQRKRLIRYFENNGDDRQGLTELPYQYGMTEDYDSLYCCICRKEVLSHFTGSGRKDIFARYWRKLTDINPRRYDILGCVYDLIKDSKTELTAGLRYIWLPMFSNDVLQLSNIASAYMKSPETSRRLAEAMLKVLENEQDDEYDIFRRSAAATLASAESLSHNWKNALLHFRQILEEGGEDMGSATVSNIGEMFLSMYEDMKDEKYLEYAESILKAVMQTREKLYKDNPCTELATAYANYAAALHYGSVDKSTEYSLKSIEVYKAIEGADSLDAAIEYSNLAIVYAGIQPQKARDYGEEALRIFRVVGGEESVHTVETHLLLGKICMNLGDWESACSHYEAASIRPETAENAGLGTYGVYDLLFKAQYFSGRYEEAVRTMEKTIGLASKDSRENIRRWADAGKAYLKLKDSASCRRCYEKAISLSMESGDHGAELENRYYYSMALNDMGGAGESNEMLSLIISKAGEYGLEESKVVAYALYNRAMSGILTGEKPQDGIADIERAIAILENRYSDDVRLIEEYRNGLEMACAKLSGESQEKAEIPEAEEMKTYLGEGLEEISEIFASGMLDFRQHLYPSAVYKFETVLERIGDSGNLSAQGLAKRYLAFAEELIFRSGEGQYTADGIRDTYLAAVNDAMADNNMVLARGTSHDYAEFCWHLGDFHAAENGYWDEILFGYYGQDFYSFESARAFYNLGPAIEKQYDSDSSAPLMLALYSLSYAVNLNSGTVSEELNEGLEQSIGYYAEEAGTEGTYTIKPGESVKAVLAYLGTSDYSRKYLMTMVLAFWMVRYYSVSEAKDKATELEFRCEYVRAAISEGQLLAAKDTIDKSLPLFEEYGDPGLLERIRLLACCFHVHVHDTDAAYEVCRKYGISDGIVMLLEESCCPCTGAYRKGSTEDAGKAAAELMEKDAQELTESECYDMILYNDLVGNRYEARKYAEIWKGKSLESRPDYADLFRPAYERIAGIINLPEQD